MLNNIENKLIEEILNKYNYAEEFFMSLGLEITSKVRNLSLENYVKGLTYDELTDCSLLRKNIVPSFINYLKRMENIKDNKEINIENITIVGGRDKSKVKEDIKIVIKPGDIISIVGPTGSGKSRLLGDIESMADRDTPTKRKVLINGKRPDPEKRFSIDYRLVAQLSQNMNYVVDLTVGEFISLHGESRMIDNIDKVIDEVITCGNELTGEQFTKETPLTQLSGGQSRALMIADTALLSSSPIILIDEIENAGVNRKKAIDILVRKDKIVFISTHDPILALLGNRRLVIKNGGIKKIIETESKERESLGILEDVDNKLLHLRELIREGQVIDFDVEKYFLKKEV